MKKRLSPRTADRWAWVSGKDGEWVFGSLAFVAVGFFMWERADWFVRTILAASIVFFGWCATTIGLRLLSRLRIEVGMEGLSAIAWRDRVVGRVPWDNVAEIELFRYRGHQFVAIDLQDPSRRGTFWYGPSLFRTLNRVWFQRDLFIEPSYEVDSERLVDEMRSCWYEHGRRSNDRAERK